ncbi:MAG: BON domain-containing protein [Verrucomicrobiae bacterium]|nr:BON domain-containing protein [Verrucomicrobiae bacterium]
MNVTTRKAPPPVAKTNAPPALSPNMDVSVATSNAPSTATAVVTNVMTNITEVVTNGLPVVTNASGRAVGGISNLATNTPVFPNPSWSGTPLVPPGGTNAPAAPPIDTNSMDGTRLNSPPTSTPEPAPPRLNETASANSTSASPEVMRDESDLVTMQLIRRAVVRDETLSVRAKNVQIVARGGEVTLRGKVTDDREKEIVVAKARQIAGPAKVHDLLEIENP